MQVTNGSVDATVTGGTAPYTYSWDNGATTEDISNVAAGTYTLTVTDANGCITTTSATVTEPTNLTASVTPTNVPCFNGMGSADLTVTGGTSPYTYSWDNGATTEDLSAVPAGTYNVTITDANGCTTTQTTTITQPAFALDVTATVVNALVNGGNGSADATVTGGTTPYTYSWSNGATTEDITAPAGTYTLTVTDANGCTDVVTVTITEPAPIVPVATPSPVLCNGMMTGSVDLTVTGGIAPYTYSWSNGATTEDLTNVPAGTYTVIVTDANGFTATTSAIVTEPTALVAVINPTNPVCFGYTGSANATVTGGTAPYTYSWSNGATTEDISNVLAGVYTLTATDANGCVTTQIVTITDPAQVPAPSVLGANVCNGTNAVLTATGATGATFQWYDAATGGNLLFTGANFTTPALTVNATYYVQQTVGGCTSLTRTDVNVTVNPNPTVNAGPDATICTGTGGVTLTAVAAGGTSPYTYTWTPIAGLTPSNAATVLANPTSTKTYIVTVRDNNGCKAKDTVVVTVYPSLTNGGTIGSNESVLWYL